MNLSTSQTDQWVGSTAEIEKALAKAGADLDQTGQFQIEPLNRVETLFGSDEDVLVTRDVRYFHGGLPLCLAELMIQETGRTIVFNKKQ